VKQIESQGRTIEEALDSGLRELQLSIGDVSWTPIQEGSKGLFGLFGSRPAKVRITVNDDSENDTFAEDVFAGLVSTAKPAAPKPEIAKPAAPAPAKPSVQNVPPVQSARTPSAVVTQNIPTKPAAPPILTTPTRPAPVQQTEAAKRPVVPPVNPRAPQQPAGTVQRAEPVRPPHSYQENRGGYSRGQSAAQPSQFQRRDKFQGNAGNDAGRYERKRYEESEPREPVTPPSEPPVIYSETEPIGRAQAYVSQIINFINNNCSPSDGETKSIPAKVYAALDDEGSIRIKIYGDVNGVLIGRRGETLDALQYLTSLHVNKAVEENHERGAFVRVSVDCENYRARREEALKRLAFRLAERAIRFGKRVPLEPMNPYERRVIHASLQDYKGITTYSEGDEPNRFVVIAPNNRSKG
jgi:spoIIIJ-associated protein